MPFAAKFLHLASRESVGGPYEIWSFLTWRSCLQASRYPLMRVKDSPPLQAIFNANPSMRALAKILRARASEHSSSFASNSSKRQILQALSNRMGPFDTPSIVCIYVWIYENGVREFAPQPGEGEDIKIKRKTSLFPLHSFTFHLLLSSPVLSLFFSLLHGLEAAFGSCEIKVDNLIIWIVWPKLLTPFSTILSFISCIFI